MGNYTGEAHSWVEGKLLDLFGISSHHCYSAVCIGVRCIPFMPTIARDLMHITNVITVLYCVYFMFCFFCLLYGHGHWVNSPALSTEYVLRTGAFDHTGRQYPPNEEMKKWRKVNLLTPLHSTLEINLFLIPWFWSLSLLVKGAWKIQPSKRGFPWKISLRFWWLHHVPLGTIC